MLTTNRWLTTTEAAAYAGVTIRVIRQAALSGALGHGRLNGRHIPKRRPSGVNYGRIRIKSTALDAWLDGR